MIVVIYVTWDSDLTRITHIFECYPLRAGPVRKAEDGGPKRGKGQAGPEKAWSLSAWVECRVIK